MSNVGVCSNLLFRTLKSLPSVTNQEICEALALYENMGPQQKDAHRELAKIKLYEPEGGVYSAALRMAGILGVCIHHKLVDLLLEQIVQEELDEILDNSDDDETLQELES